MSPHQQQTTQLCLELSATLLSRQRLYRASGGWFSGGAARCECVLRCPLCVGSNLLVVDGVSRPCKQPSPGAVITRLNRASIPARFAQASLDNFTNLKGDMKQHLKTLRGWLKDFKPASSQGLVVVGACWFGQDPSADSLDERADC